ncbi:trimeric intracellular cation channel family protein [Candidatus Sulfurimonas marisnigri]|uniref:Trimeric intracellular cation channel family protein n=1 Tax=Candidatus Sulfurimonas marisnigri TaxID=2740405 RepID=A0A7S7M0P7_9BACT|nr:trimeric intracellular cation channel family protein [Candidatus Sulfurimonas marisnigri]QOY54094.1 trimeric intracellular cation channel family protein [Candidatus Sulfurimonas marisnigri]
MQYTVFLDIIGTIAFALSGYILAAKAKYDILGILVIAFITAFGGGVVRDLLVDRMPYIFLKTYPITIVIITIITAYIFKLHKNTTLTDNLVFIISDSIGLSIFAFTGAIVALESGFNLAGIMFLSFLTAVGGGIIRDMMMNKVPFVLTNDFYGTVAFILGFLVWLLSTMNLLNSASTIILLIFGIIMRLMAIKFKWKLPKLI